MRRKLTVRFVGVTVVALVVAGLISLLLAAREDRESDRRELVSQVEGLAGQGDQQTTRASLPVVRRALRLREAELLVFDADGRLVTGKMPDGLDVGDLDLERLRADEVESGSWGRRVYAAAALDRAVRRPAEPRATPVVLITRTSSFGLGRSLVYFAVAAVLALAVAVIVALQLSRRLATPVAEAENAARRIAEGDLSVRLPSSERDPEELARLAASVNSMAEALERSKGLERQFLLSVSHDLRTPMTSIRGFAEAIADGTADDPARAAGVIATEAQRLERLVSDLLQLATLDARAFTLHPKPLDLRHVVAETVAGFEPMADSLDVALDYQPAEAGAPVMVSADPDRLSQIVANLVENALKYADTDVRVGVEPPGVITVDDDGQGIAADDLPHVFGRLYQSPADSGSSTRPAGSGLGLAIVAELAAAMGAQVRAENLPQGGTRFVIALPALRDGV